MNSAHVGVSALASRQIQSAVETGGAGRPFFERPACLPCMHCRIRMADADRLPIPATRHRRSRPRRQSAIRHPISGAPRTSTAESVSPATAAVAAATHSIWPVRLLHRGRGERYRSPGVGDDYAASRKIPPRHAAHLERRPEGSIRPSGLRAGDCLRKLTAECAPFLLTL